MGRVFASILLIVSVLLLIPMPSQAKVYIVSVGISDYPGTANDLRLPVNDADAVYSLFNTNTTCKSIIFKNQEATLANVEGALHSYFAGAAKDDVIIFYFSGHGYPGGFNLYDKMLSYSKIKKAMASSKCMNKIIIADACFSGKLRQQKQSSTSQMTKNLNVLLFLSSRDNETSIESARMKNGFFTTYLIQALRGHADMNRDSVIVAKELFTYVHDGVIKISKDKQHPVMYGRFSDTMPIMSWKKNRKK